jgi:hypothetical protein
MALTLVDPEVTKRKFKRELALWKAHGGQRDRGWVLLSKDETIPQVELALLVSVTTGGPVNKLDVVVCAIRLVYENYDLWPPSLSFIDVFTRDFKSPQVRAFLATVEGPRDVLVDGHPNTNRPFLCLPGIREYHTHPQHTGDEWHLHRPTKEGSISVVCERLWLTMAKNVIGLRVALQTLPTVAQQAQFAIQVMQGDIENMTLIIRQPSPGA